MLIFKINIYQPDNLQTTHNNPEPGLNRLDIAKFLKDSLEKSQQYFSLIESEHRGTPVEELAGRFPQASRFGNKKALQPLGQNILQGHLCGDAWYRMNCYHYCVLYDSILHNGYCYNHMSLEEKLKQYPELKGKLLQVVNLVESIFFHTGFLMNADSFDLLTSLEKQQKGLDSPGLFGVVHGLAPAPDEFELQVQPGFPYSIAV